MDVKIWFLRCLKDNPPRVYVHMYVPGGVGVGRSYGPDIEEISGLIFDNDEECLDFVINLKAFEELNIV